MNVGEVWLVDFPYEDDATKSSPRPAIILDIDTILVLAVKVTKHEPREEDKYDTPLLYWEKAKLHLKSTARISKAVAIQKSQFIHKIGDLDEEDLLHVQHQYMLYFSEKN